MKRLLLLAPLALAACTAGQAVNTAGTVAATTADAVGVMSPSDFADKTMLDEQGMLACENFYKAARIAVETGVDAGLIKGEAAAKVAALDNQAYAALGAVRSAYRAGNAQSYKNALREAQAATANLLSLTGR